MGNWIVRAKVTVTDDNGKDKRVTETHLVKAENITEVQTIVAEYYKEYNMDHEIRSIGKSGIMEYLPRK
jgi:hypothetical protein